MTPLQELEVRAADIRRRFGEIGAMSGDALTEEITAELAALRAEHAANELRQTALKLSGDVAPTPIESAATEGVEYRNLLRRANVGEIFHVAVHGGVTSGATAELQQAHGLDVRQVPLAMLIQDMEGLETRAAIAAPADVQGNQQGILMYVFPQSAGTWLGIDMPSVPTGEAIFPILTTAPTVRLRRKVQRRVRQVRPSRRMYWFRNGCRRHSDTPEKIGRDSPGWTKHCAKI